jgi:hypothetical protein
MVTTIETRPGGLRTYGADPEWSGRLSDEVTWDPWHTWVDGVTTWVDGQLLVNGARLSTYLDVGCFGDECCSTNEWRDGAKLAWEKGSVLAVKPYESAQGVTALIVPSAALSTELITLALARFHP